MEHSISDVARMAGVTSRTLRHYDDIGLLNPARAARNGYRWYGRPELLRLQRILLLRELRVPLPQIQQVLDGDTDELASLRRHREDLAAERDRLEQIITTVDRTIADLCGTETLTDDEFFTGLATRREALRNDLKSRYGDSVDDHFASAVQATAGWTRQDHEHAAEQGRQLLRQLSHARAGGVAPDSEQALDLMVEHYQGVRAMWPADAAAYHALADLVLDNPDQRTMIEGLDPSLPAWLANAIRAYATRRLGYSLGPTPPSEPVASR